MEHQFYAVAASGYGIESLIQFLRNIPPDTGASFIITTHIPRNHRSNLDSLLSKAITMPVIRVESEQVLHPNHLYLLIENTYLHLKGKTVYPSVRPEDQVNRAIDTLFKSLAESFGEKAIGIILDGDGFDGLEGVKAIEKEGGYVMVQQPPVSRIPQMTQHAIDGDSPDVIAETPRLALHLKKHLQGLRMEK